VFPCWRVLAFKGTVAEFKAYLMAQRELELAYIARQGGGRHTTAA
jgi:hypothetical protein